MKIVVRPQGQKWKVVESALYGEEKELQSLLEQSPELIPMGELQPGAGEARLVLSEFAISGSLYLDLLAFTSAGEIVLLECKLRSNAEIKRKVIGQLFEYAGFLWNMPFEELDAKVRQMKGRGLLEAMGEVVQEDWSAERFRESVEQNLANGRFVLAIVVDRVTDELQRAAMFITACGKANYSFHVVEMERYQALDVEVLTPRVHGGVAPLVVAGGTPALTQRKGRLSKEQFLEEVNKRAPELRKTAEHLYTWAEAKADSLGTGGDSFSFRVVNKQGAGTTIFGFYPDGRLEFGLQTVRESAGEEVLQQFLKTLMALPAFKALRADMKFPTARLQQPLSEGELAQFTEAVIRVRDALHQ